MAFAAGPVTRPRCPPAPSRAFPAAFSLVVVFRIEIDGAKGIQDAELFPRSRIPQGRRTRLPLQSCAGLRGGLSSISRSSSARLVAMCDSHYTLVCVDPSAACVSPAPIRLDEVIRSPCHSSVGSPVSQSGNILRAPHESRIPQGLQSRTASRHGNADLRTRGHAPAGVSHFHGQVFRV